MGVTYFKLKSDYRNDCTKNCGLTGEEIDRNFHFLRGYDIEGVEIDNATGVLTLKRVNGEEMHVKAGETIGDFKIEFDPIKGVLTYTTFNGKKYEVEGFLSEFSSVHMSTDYTIDGDGTMTDPLRVSALGRTGTYAPATTLFDCVSGENLPKGETVGKGYRAVTREKIDKMGKLYNLDGLKKIMEDLKNTEWRVPSKDDWDAMLNSIELCDDDKNHTAKTSNSYLGENAGSFLKSLNIWDSYPVKEDEYSLSGEDKFKFNILPLGYGTNRPTMVEGEDVDAEGLRKITAFWTSTQASDIDDMFVKEFSYRSRKVRQYSKEPDAYLSVRLVKDYVGNNYNEIENINGQTIPCVMMMDSATIWTQVNIGFSHEQYNGASSIEWSELTDEEKGLEVRYFINEWEGDKWVKGEIKEGETIVLFDYADQKYHEWKLINGEFIDVLAALKKEFEEEFVEIRTEIEDLKETDKILQDQITNNANEIDVLKERADNAELRLDSAEERIEKTESRLDKIEPQLENHEDRITKIETLVEEHEERLDVIEGDENVDGSIKNALKLAKEYADSGDEKLQIQITQNKLVEDVTNSLVITPNADGNGTTIKVNIPNEHGNIKVDENGLYFDGFMGNF